MDQTRKTACPNRLLTIEFLRRMAVNLGGKKKAGSLLRKMRNKLAIELVRGQTQLISELNRRNIGAKGRW